MATEDEPEVVRRTARIRREAARRAVANSNSNSNGYGATVSRIEQSLVEQERAFQLTRDKVNSLDAKLDVTTRDVGNLSVSIDKLISRFESTQKTNWPLLGAIFGFIPAILGASVYVVNGQITNSVAPLGTRVAAIEVIDQTYSEAIRRLTAAVDLSTQADVNSKTNRAAMEENIRKLQEQVAQISGDQKEFAARTNTQLAEAETQFDSSRQIDDVHLAHQMRMNSLLWEKAFPGSRYPDQVYYPQSTYRFDPENRRK